MPLLLPPTAAPPDADAFRGGSAGPPLDVNGEGDEEGEARGPATVAVEVLVGRFGNGGVGRGRSHAVLKSAEEEAELAVVAAPPFDERL